MWAKRDHQKEIDVNSIKPPERCVKRVLGDPRHYWDSLEASVYFSYADPGLSLPLRMSLIILSPVLWSFCLSVLVYPDAFCGL